ncbi:hypothetical protein [Duffyella gerundensis]|uniref:transcriptional antitermination N peptide n=1 Tax=Duffyella TaxID=3026546 RepID=UPI003F6DB3C9
MTIILYGRVSRETAKARRHARRRAAGLTAKRHEKARHAEKTAAGYARSCCRIEKAVNAPSLRDTATAGALCLPGVAIYVVRPRAKV